MLGLLVSGGVALWIAILFTPFLIRYFHARDIGQHIREDGPATHVAKAGTPTMGGIAIVASVVLGYAIGHIGTEIRFSRTGYLAIGTVVAFGLIGYLDDYIKISHKRSLGLNKRGKSAAQILCALPSRSSPCTGRTPPPNSRSPVSASSGSTSARSAGSSSPSSSWSGRRTR